MRGVKLRGDRPKPTLWEQLGFIVVGVAIVLILGGSILEVSIVLVGALLLGLLGGGSDCSLASPSLAIALRPRRARESAGPALISHALPPPTWADPSDNPETQVALLVLAEEPGKEGTAHDGQGNSRTEPDTFWVFHLNAAGDVTDDDAFISWRKLWSSSQRRTGFSPSDDSVAWSSVARRLPRRTTRGMKSRGASRSASE